MLKAEILGQLLLMQSIIINLPDKKSMLSFVKKGLLDIPGVKSCSFYEGMWDRTGASEVVFTLKNKNNLFGSLVIELYDADDFYPYHDYIKNFIVMIEITLEEKYQRALNEKYQAELEKKVKESTKELSFEIRQRQQIEASLKKSEQLFSASFENITTGVCLVTPDGQFKKVNAQMCRIVGYPEKELLNKTIYDITYPDDLEIGALKMNELIAGGSDYASFEKRYVHKNGTVVHVNISTAMVRNILNGPEHFLSYVHDISSQVKTNEALRLSEYNYKTLFENMTTGFAYHKMIYDGKGLPVDYVFLSANRAFEKLTGLKAEKLIGKTAREAIPGLEQHWIDTYGKVAITGKPIKFENFAGDLDKYFEVKAYSPEKDHFAVMFNDITRNKKAELALQESEEKFRTFFENINEASALHKIVTDENGVPVDFEFIDINPAYEAVTQLKAQNVIGQLGTKAIPNLEDKWIEIYGKVALTGESISFVEHSDYLDSFWDIKAFCPKKGYFAVAFTDVTEMIKTRIELERSEQQLKEQNHEYEALNEELKQTNEELYKAKERAEESDRLKSAFLANMSHEIRTPMNGMIGFIDLLKGEDATPDKKKHFIDVIQVSCYRLLNVVNDIIDISKIETGQVKVNMGETDIDEVLQELYEFFKPNAQKNNIGFYLHFEDRAKALPIMTDKVKLTQVLNNLLSNAIKFTSEGQVRFGYRIMGKWVEFFVEDTGMGIPEDQHEIVFDRFQQARQEDNLKFGGTGLGLAIAKAYVEIIGGKIGVGSKPGKGSVFKFTIPYHPVSNKTGNVPHKQVEFSSNGITALVIEDEAINLLLLEEILGELNIKVLHAHNGKETLEVLKKRPKVDIVLLDIKLPDICGYELAKEINKFLPGVPIVAQTAYALEGDRCKALQAGCTDYVPKPLDRKKLIEIIAKQTNMC
jgi:PAS domain S-box-containing protein